MTRQASIDLSGEPSRPARRYDKLPGAGDRDASGITARNLCPEDAVRPNCLVGAATFPRLRTTGMVRDVRLPPVQAACLQLQMFDSGRTIKHLVMVFAAIRPPSIDLSVVTNLIAPGG